MNTKIIKLDINRRLYDKIVAKQDDTKSRFLLFQLLDGAVPFNLTDRSVRVYGVKPDGAVIFNDLTVTHSTTGFCLLELTNQMLAIAGTVKLELMITEGDKKLTSIPFEMEVIKKINSNAAVESSNEFRSLLNALKEIDEWNKEFADKSGKLEELYTPRLNELGSQLETNVQQFQSYSDVGLFRIDGKSDTQILKDAFNSGKSIITLEQDKIYNVNEELQLPNNFTLYFNGAKIIFNLDGNVRGLVLGNNNRLFDVDIEVKSTNASDSAQSHNCISIGEVIEGQGVKNVYINGLYVTSNKPNGALVGIYGNSENVIIENVNIPSNNYICNPFIIHWGNTSRWNTQQRTTHPNNIRIRNVVCGDLTNSNLDTNLIFMAGAYNVKIENVKTGFIANRGIMIFSGDCGFYYGTETDKANAMKGIEINNFQCEVSKWGLEIKCGGSIIPEVALKYKSDITINNFHSRARKTNDSGHGVKFDVIDGITFNNCSFSKHTYGIYMNNEVRNVIFNECSFYDNYRSGCYIDYNEIYGVTEDIKFKNCKFYNNGSGDSGSFRSGSYLNRAKRITFEGCIFGGFEEELYQFFSIRLNPTALDITITNCHTNNIIDGGTCYSLGSGSSTGLIKSFYNNTCKDGLLLTGGMTQVPILTKSDGTYLY